MNFISPLPARDLQTPIGDIPDARAGGRGGWVLKDKIKIPLARRPVALLARPWVAAVIARGT